MVRKFGKTEKFLPKCKNEMQAKSVNNINNKLFKFVQLLNGCAILNNIPPRIKEGKLIRIDLIEPLLITRFLMINNTPMNKFNKEVANRTIENSTRSISCSPIKPDTRTEIPSEKLKMSSPFSLVNISRMANQKSNLTN